MVTVQVRALSVSNEISANSISILSTSQLLWNLVFLSIPSWRHSGWLHRQIGKNGDLFTNGLWAHDWNTVKISLVEFLFWWSNQVTNFHLSWQLSCCGKIKILTWTDNHFWFVFYIRATYVLQNFGSYIIGDIGHWTFLLKIQILFLLLSTKNIMLDIITHHGFQWSFFKWKRWITGLLQRNSSFAWAMENESWDFTR